MKTITDNTEFDQIIAGDKPVVLDFYADWCASCQALLPILKDASNHYAENVVIAKINVEKNPELAAKYKVRSIPAVFLIKNGAVVDQFNGVQTSAEIHKRIDDLIAANIEKPADPTT